MSKYIVFSKPSCPFCVKAVELLKEKKAVNSVVNFNGSMEQQVLLSEIKSAYDYETVPMIFKRDGNSVQFIGGYTDLVEHFSQDG